MPISRDKFRPISGSETKKIHDELTRLPHQEYRVNRLTALPMRMIRLIIIACFTTLTSDCHS